MQVEDLTPEQLEAILGTDYETVLADILRQKASADERRNTRKEIGQVGDGNVFFDPAGAIDNVLSRRRAEKEMQGAQGQLDATLAKQTAGRKTFAEALGRKPQPMGAPRSVDSTIPGQMPPQAPMQPTVPGAPPMAQGAPPALANAQNMPPRRLQAAGVPPDVQALLAKLRGQ
jgi:hypothetical protein